VNDKIKYVILLFLVIAIACQGCASIDTKKDKPAKEYADEGMESYNDKDYKYAIESFQKIKDWYPFSKYSVLADLKIADSHYKLKQYNEAVAAYEEFEKLHPANESVPYVIFQTGLCYFEQVNTPDRQQATARKTIETFNRLNKLFPKNEYSLKTSTYINKCYKSIAKSELGIGLFYYKSKHYKAALHRFKNVITRYPDTGAHHEAITYIAKCETAIIKK